MNLSAPPKTPSYSPSREQPRKVVLKVENLVKIYKKRTVVDGVSFEVREGEVVGLLGSNGAGKTTSFRMACGLIPANSGKVILNGIDVTHWPMYRRAKEGHLGYLPQDRSTFGALTTEQNLYAAMEFLGYPRSEIDRCCEEMLKKFNLLHIRKTKVGMGGSGGLSGGERRRLEIARALLAHPKILLLDEPFANVDPLTVEEMQKVIRELSVSGVAVLITDHQVDETLAITDRSYIVSKGKILCSGTPLEVLSNPAAIKTYFGQKAQFNRERLLRKLAGETLPSDDKYDVDTSEVETTGLNQTSAQPESNVFDNSNGNDEHAIKNNELKPRPTLTLTRRNDGVVRRTPSPRDEQREPNRFDGMLGRLFRRK